MAPPDYDMIPIILLDGDESRYILIRRQRSRSYITHSSPRAGVTTNLAGMFIPEPQWLAKPKPRQHS